MERIIERALQHWHGANDIEITLEANPSSVEIEGFKAFRLAGVNRVSIGVQALRDDDLRRLGRLHSSAEAKAAIAAADAVFDRYSFDLIHSRQYQTAQDWEVELAEAIALGADHMSIYQLTIEDGTVFGRRFADGMLSGLPEEAAQIAFDDATDAAMRAAGFDRYEVSNFGRKGEASQHNQMYWCQGDYAGIGPGAHGRLTTLGVRWATETHLSPMEWVRAVQDGGTGERDCYALSQSDHANEMMMMGLRQAEGIDVNRWERIVGYRFEVPKELLELGLAKQRGTRFCATKAGRRLLNQIIQRVMV